MDPRRISPSTASALGRIIIIDLAVIATPPVLAANLPQSRHGEHRFVPQLANNLALVGYTIVALQFILAARLKWIERPFGLDMIFVYHKAMAMLAVASTDRDLDESIELVQSGAVTVCPRCGAIITRRRPPPLRGA